MDRIKESRADITYVPLCRSLKDVVYFPQYKSEVEQYDKILEHYQKHAEEQANLEE